MKDIKAIIPNVRQAWLQVPVFETNLYFITLTNLCICNLLKLLSLNRPKVLTLRHSFAQMICSVAKCASCSPDTLFIVLSQRKCNTATA